MHNLIINGDKYNIDIVKSNELNIVATNNVTNISYAVSLNGEKIRKITAGAGLIRDMDKFYEMFKMGLNNNENIMLAGKTGYGALTLILTIDIVKELGYLHGDNIYYIIFLDKVHKSEIIRMEETSNNIIELKINNVTEKINKIQKIFSEIKDMIIINKEMTNDLRDEFVKFKQHIQHEIIDFSNKINDCNQKKKKWNYININNPIYNFECAYDFSMYLSSDIRRPHIELNGAIGHVTCGLYDPHKKTEFCCHKCKGESRCKLCQNINDIISWNANNNEFMIAIPNILHHPKKIKINILAKFHEKIFIKLYTNKNNTQYLECNDDYNIYKRQRGHMIFNLEPSDTHVYVGREGVSNGVDISINLVGYKD